MMLLILGISLPLPARVVDRIVSFVNDDIITLHELEGRIEERALELQQVYRFTPEEAQQRAEGEQEKLLDQMQRERLLYQEARLQQVEVAESEIDQYIDNFKKNAGLESDEQLRSELRRRDLSLEEFREQARHNLMAQNLVWQVIVPKLNVTDREIDQFFEEHRSDFPTKLDDVRLRHVFIAYQPTEEDVTKTRETAIEVLKQAKQPDADFVQLVRQYSQSPQTREQDGLIELRPEQLEKFPEAFRQAVEALTPGEIAGPVRTSEGFHVIRLENRSEVQIQLRHIFLPIIPGEAAKQASQDRVATVLQRLESGDAFDAVARELSEDEDTKASGGDLGLRHLSDFPTNVREVIERMKAGEQSTPVPTDFGVHIFLLEERTPATLTAEEREQARTLLRQQKFEEKWQDYTDDLKAKAFVKTNL